MAFQDCSARGHLWDHMPDKYCHICGGSGRIGFHRWRYDPRRMGMVPVPPDPCHVCKGTGRKGKRHAANCLPARPNGSGSDPSP
jgi:hypothetical protein